MINLKEALAELNINCSGVIHVWGHKAQEYQEYKDAGLTHQVWIEANPHFFYEIINVIKEDETVNMKDGVKNIVVTRLGLQVKFVNAETGEYFTGSGLGDAKTVRELTLMNDDNFSEVKFNQSTIGTSTKKALEIAAGKILLRMHKKGIFKMQ